MKNRYLIILISILLTYRVYSQQPTYVGISKDSFNYSASSQQNSQWCWAASIQMVLNYYGVAIDQKQIVARTYGVSSNGQLPNWAGNFQAITANLNNWSIDNNGQTYGVQASFNFGAPSPAYLIQELSAQHPVIIGYKSGPNSGHAVVITAISYIQTQFGPQIQTIIVRDPFPTAQNIANLGRVEYSAINLATQIQAHWYIRINK